MYIIIIIDIIDIILYITDIDSKSIITIPIKLYPIDFIYFPILTCYMLFNSFQFIIIIHCK
jgi:hypothetical protein